MKPLSGTGVGGQRGRRPDVKLAASGEGGESSPSYTRSAGGIDVHARSGGSRDSREFCVSHCCSDFLTQQAGLPKARMRDRVRRCSRQWRNVHDCGRERHR